MKKLICLLSLVCLCHVGLAQGVVDPYRFVSADPCVTCVQNASAFNVKLTGGANIASSSSAFTGLADSKTITVSFWIQRTSVKTTGTILYIAGSGGVNERFSVKLLAAGIIVIGNNSSGSIVLQATTAAISTGVWHHILITVDMADSAKRKIYVDGVSAGVWATYNNDTIDLAPNTSPYRSLFDVDGSAGVNALVAYLAELWVDDSYNDNVCYFYCGTRPATLGANGLLPNGAMPAAYYSLSGHDLSWFTDSSGNANTYSFISGTPTHTTSP